MLNMTINYYLMSIRTGYNYTLSNASKNLTLTFKKKEFNRGIKLPVKDTF